jgi:hypothetical protein
MTQLDRLMGVLRLATTAILSAILRDHTAPAARPNPDAPDAPDAFLDIVAISARIYASLLEPESGCVSRMPNSLKALYSR